jgi:hypothetical protein
LPANQNNENLLKQLNSLKLEMQGEWADRNRVWKSSDPGIPKCILADLKEQDPGWSPYTKEQDERKKTANDQIFLKTRFPHIYNQYFDDKGNIKSGSEAFVIAWESFFGRILSSDLSNLGNIGFSLLIFSLSVVTSAGATVALITHTRRKDTQLSHDPKVEAAILEHLAYLERAAQLTVNSAAESLAEPVMPLTEITTPMYKGVPPTQSRSEQSHDITQSTPSNGFQPEQSHELPQNPEFSRGNKPRRGKYRPAID